MSPNLPRLLRTVAHLTPGQVTSRIVHVARTQAYRRLARFPISWLSFDAHARGALREPLELETTLPVAEIIDLWRQGQVSYHGIKGPRDDWKASGHTRLWQYEKHYHVEALALGAAGLGNTPEAARARDDLVTLVAGWQKACPPLAGASWEPYPIARRVLHWSLALAACPQLGPTLAGRLAPQVRHLHRHLETHLLGNHLLCDLFAVVAGCAVLEAPGLDALAAVAREELCRQLRAQTLRDGGYAERTAQYHAVVLRDLLWTIALTNARGRPLALEAHATHMMQWLGAVVRSDGSFPWINDAAPDTTPAWPALLRLAHQVGLNPEETLETPVPRPAPEGPLVLHETGWLIWRPGKSDLLFDFGLVGPPEQPGHGHADALGFELIWEGEPLVTDTGITTYAANETRAYERSAAAHATVSVDGEGSDEVWASFRVGGRAAPYLARVSLDAPGALAVQAVCKSFRGWRHERRLEFTAGKRLVVEDHLEGSFAQAASHVPLAPGWQLTDEGGALSLVKGSQTLRFRVLAGGPARVAAGWQSAGFEHKVPRQVIHVPLVAGRASYEICA
ncbi:MAG: heparinase II/III-family protein [Myxococcales bacterium]|nr:heparinase II/III-family protein [Myxococcales bacterium]